MNGSDNINELLSKLTSDSQSDFPSQPNLPPLSGDDVVNIVLERDKSERTIMVQFEENEKSKRELKPTILWWVCGFIAFQLIIMNAILLIIILSLVTGDSNIWFINTMDSNNIPAVFDFLKFYISVTTVELLSMLYFMIRKVFDNSIADFFRINRQSNKDNKK